MHASDITKKKKKTFAIIVATMERCHQHHENVHGYRTSHTSANMWIVVLAHADFQMQPAGPSDT